MNSKCEALVPELNVRQAVVDFMLHVNEGLPHEVCAQMLIRRLKELAAEAPATPVPTPRAQMVLSTLLYSAFDADGNDITQLVREALNTPVVPDETGSEKARTAAWAETEALTGIWYDMSSCPDSDDLLWFCRGDTFDGPRTSTSSDVDYWDFWCYAKPPTPFPEDMKPTDEPQTELDLSQFDGRTPGPWLFDSGIVPPDGPERYSTITAADGDVVIAEVNDMISEGDINARLIAAAPLLLAELRRLRDVRASSEESHKGEPQ